jgi:hypothetical protein
VTGAGTEHPRYFTRLGRTPISPEQPQVYTATDVHGKEYLAAYGGTDEKRFAYLQKFIADPKNAKFLAKFRFIKFAHEVPTANGPALKVDEIGASGLKNKGFFSLIMHTFTGPQNPPDPSTFIEKVGN